MGSFGLIIYPFRFFVSLNKLTVHVKASIASLFLQKTAIETKQYHWESFTPRKF